MTVFEPVSRECFRVDSRRLFRGLESENTIFVVFSGASAPARLDQSRPGSAGLRYAAFGRLDLLYMSLCVYI